MRNFCFVLLLFLNVGGYAEGRTPDEEMLSKTQALYDAPFTKALVSFDCAVQFDWKSNFIETLGQVPPAAAPTLRRLQVLERRVFVDRSGAVVSDVPKAVDLSDVPHGADLEKVLQAMVSSGLNAWLPFATDVILPLKPTRFSFQQEATGYKVTMNGGDVEATLSLDSEMRITSVISQRPQALRFATEFVDGPGGYLLRSLKISSDTSSEGKWESMFVYAYQDVQGLQLPASVVVTNANHEHWRYSLNDCKAVRGITVKVGPPVR